MKEYIDLPPLMSAQGNITLPGSKSISNRVLLLAALSEGVTIIHDILDSDDTRVMLAALHDLGVGLEFSSSIPDSPDVFVKELSVNGVGGIFLNKNAKFYLGNAGTAFRPLAAVLALSQGSYEMFGGGADSIGGRMHERPIGDLVDALRQLGADIEYLGNEGYPPLKIKPAMLAGDTVEVKGDVSSQFLTGLLMALPLTGRTVRVEVVGELISKPYIEITLAMMERFGVKVEHQNWQSFFVFGGQRYKSPGTIHVEGDASSASYFLAAGAIGGGPVRVMGVGKSSVQGDVRFAEALEKMGARISMGPNWMEAKGPASGRLKAIDLDCNHIPDAAMTLAVAALYADGETTLRNIASWRVKETDRIHAMATELRKVGAEVEEGADYIKISGLRSEVNCQGETAVCARSPLPAPRSSIDTYDDHRMAMCFSLAAFGRGLRINDPECVNKTFPDYFSAFSRVTKSVPVIAIDGPSASGKGTVAQRVAQRLDFHYLDSGALYRLLALAADRDGVPLDDEAALAALAERMDVEFRGEQIWLDGMAAGDELRGEACAAAASKVAALPGVRAALLAKQRAFRRAPGLVTDGRDMGSVVFPDAMAKIFLTATAEARAERRYKQLKEKGMSANISALLQDIRARDERDMQRSAAPLQQTPGASLLDTTALTIDQAVDSVLASYREKAPKE
jgi:3-phosphoshikimate 1-carboxyvinyltransferase